ncbi:MAG: nuclear transport factor 2 family protein [Proteobacteria bacterium]|nr:nuclear transport factor 2 family protein [Pseudomonadota bacterium]MDA1057060.1 nuclear transport factor 2 family protein [Pseudomonadota bacterium]
MARDRNFYIEAVVRGYFGAMDSGDVDGTVACFAPDATLTWESNNVRLTGHDELRPFFAELCAGTNAMAHEVTNFVVDTDKGTCAVEIIYRNERTDGTLADMANCNFFDFGADGKFTRVRFWSGGSVD